MNFDEKMTPELREKLKNAKTPEELLVIAKEEGYELSSDQLESIAGGNWCSTFCTEIYFCRDDCPHKGL